MGFTAWGGLFATLFNLYLLRLGYGPEVIGRINAAGSLAFGLLCLPAGWIGAHWGSRHAMTAGLALVGLSHLLAPQAGAIPANARLEWLIGATILGSFGASLYAVNTAPYLMGITSTSGRSYAFSVQSAVWPLCAFAGSLLGGFLPGLFAGILGLQPGSPQPYRLALMVSAACFIPAVVAMSLARDGDSTPSRMTATASAPAPWAFIVLIALVLALQVSAEGAIRTFFNVYMDQSLSVPTAQIGIFASFGNLAAGTAALFTPFLVARLGISAAFIATSLSMSAMTLPIALIPSPLAAGFSFAGVIGSASMSRPVINLYQMESVPPRWRSAIAAAGTFSVGASWAVVSAAGGALIVNASYSAMFLAAAAATAAGGLLFAAHRRFGFARSDTEV